MLNYNADDYARSVGTQVQYAEGFLNFIMGFLAIIGTIAMVIGILMIISMWKIFTKAGKPGWAALVPFYNLWVLYEIVGLEGWMSLLGLIPFFGPFVIFVLNIVAAVRLPEYFGKEPVYAVGLIFLPVIFYPMLAFGPCEYTEKTNKVETAE